MVPMVPKVRRKRDADVASARLRREAFAKKTSWRLYLTQIVRSFLRTNRS